MTRSDSTIPSQSVSGSNGNYGVLFLPQNSNTLARPLDCFVSYPGYLFGDFNHLQSLTPLQRFSRYILQPKPTGPENIHWVGCYFSAEMRLVYSTASAYCITVHSLGESYSSAEIQSVYSTTPADWATEYSWGSITHRQRCSWCILQPQSTGLSILLITKYKNLLFNIQYLYFKSEIHSLKETASNLLTIIQSAKFNFNNFFTKPENQHCSGLQWLYSKAIVFFCICQKLCNILSLKKRSNCDTK